MLKKISPAALKSFCRRSGRRSRRRSLIFSSTCVPSLSLLRGLLFPAQIFFPSGFICMRVACCSSASSSVAASSSTELTSARPWPLCRVSPPVARDSRRPSILPGSCSPMAEFGPCARGTLSLLCSPAFSPAERLFQRALCLSQVPCSHDRAVVSFVRSPPKLPWPVLGPQHAALRLALAPSATASCRRCPCFPWRFPWEFLSVLRPTIPLFPPSISLLPSVPTCSVSARPELA